MKKSLILFLTSIIFMSLNAQKNELITVKSGHRILDYFPINQRYRYPQFVTGKVVFKNNVYSVFKLNYNILLGEMEFIQNRDTLIIANKRDVKDILVAGDTFYYDRVYLEHLTTIGYLDINLSQYFKVKEILKKDAYGVSSSGSSTTSLGSLPKDGNFYKLSAPQDIIFQKITEYYISKPGSGFIPYKKKQVMQLFPEYEDRIKSFLKSNDIDFDSVDDLIKLTGYIAGLIK